MLTGVDKSNSYTTKNMCGHLMNFVRPHVLCTEHNLHDMFSNQKTMQHPLLTCHASFSQNHWA